MGRKPKSAKIKPTAKVAVNPEAEANTCSVGTPSNKKASKDKSVIVRRSVRLGNFVSPDNNEIREAEAGETILIDSEKEDQPHVDQDALEQIPVDKNSEEKIDNHVQTAKKTEEHLPGDSSSTILSYKALYFGSQKKIEALTEENNQLYKKLSFALGKLEVYEKVSGVIDKLKDVILITNLRTAAETGTNPTSQTLDHQVSPANKKRRVTGRKKD